MKTLAAAAMALATALSAYAVPTENTFTAVTNDWYVGRWANVLELAQTRLAANSNDLVGAHLVVSYDVLFSDIPAISNSVTRLIGAMDASSEPAMTNLISQLRPGWVYFRDEFLPRQTAADVQAQHEKSRGCVAVEGRLWIIPSAFHCAHFAENFSASISVRVLTSAVGLLYNCCKD